MLTASKASEIRKVLIVDDESTMRLLARAALEKDGFVVAEAGDGQEALTIFKNFLPDLILMDVLMPQLDGFGACLALRRLPRGEQVPIVMVTGLDDLTSINRAYDAGATDFITKPINLQGKETVLLVEDEELVRRVARRILEKFSYTVLEAESGATALRLGEQHPEPIHLLLTDVVMPGMSGKELAECWRQQHPETLVLYTSGYTENAIVQQGSLDRDTHFIQKPYRPELLARKIREVLDGSASPHQLQYWGEL